MKRNIYFVLVLVSVIYLSSMYFLGKNAGSKTVPSPAATATPTITPTPTPVKTPSPTPKPTVKPTPTPTPVSSAEINSFIERFASQYSVDPNIIRHVALCESGFRSDAENAGYAGLFQFGVVTWKNLRKEIGEDTNPALRYSAEESVQTAAYALSKGKDKIWPNCDP